ncbi:MAG: hypothetical protein AVDCRST_MAG71-638, partial [uncultured Lysobacter sp.]
AFSPCRNCYAGRSVAFVLQPGCARERSSSPHRRRSDRVDGRGHGSL